MIRAGLAFLLSLPVGAGAQTASYSFDDAQRFLKANCSTCHQGVEPAGGFSLREVSTAETIRSRPERWAKLALRVRNGEMPPRAAGAPALAERGRFLEWTDSAL